MNIAVRLILPLLALGLATCATHTPQPGPVTVMVAAIDRKSTRLNSSH